MAKSDQLFLLIKAMTRSEKRYFKVSGNKNSPGGEKDYLRLFDAIDVQQEYDEAALHDKFKNEPYFKKLRNVKFYLYQQILKSLRNFYDEVSFDVRLNNYLAEIEIFFKKELFRNCSAAIKKAMAYAQRYEKIPQLLKVIEWEIKLSDSTNNLQSAKMLNRRATKDAKEAMQKYSEIIELRQMYLDSRAIFETAGEVRTSAESEILKNILKHPLMRKKLNSFQGENYRLTIKAHHAHSIRDFEAASTGIEKMEKLYGEHTYKLGDDINAYFNNLLVLAISAMTAKKFKIAERIVEKVNDIYQKKYEELSFKNKIKLLYTETELLSDKGEFAAALSMIPKVNKLVEENNKEINPMEEIFVYHLKFNVYFRNKNFKQSQHYIQKIINYNAGIRQDIQSSARLVNLILQYEQGEYEHLGYIVPSVYRYLMKKKRLYKPENLILNFIRKAVKFTSEKKLLAALAELKKQIQPYMNEPFIVDFPLIEWIDSKLQKKELQDIVRERYLKAIAEEKTETSMKMTG